MIVREVSLPGSSEEKSNIHYIGPQDLSPDKHSHLTIAEILLALNDYKSGCQSESGLLDLMSQVQELFGAWKQKMSLSKPLLSVMESPGPEESLQFDSDQDTGPEVT